MDFKEAFARELENSKVKLIENKSVKKESIVTEDTEEYLEPRFDSRASFYKKARVVKKDNGDEELYSYGTHVGGVRNGKPYSKGKFSQTTSRHQKEYFTQKGFDSKDISIEEGKLIEARNNVIPRNWSKITFKSKIDTSAGPAGATYEIYKDEYDRPVMKNTEDSQEYYVNWSVVRNPELAEIVNIEKGLNESKKVKKVESLGLKDLTPEQKSELKQRYLTDKYDANGRTPSQGELAKADELVSDEELEKEYDGIDFVNDDFFCTAGQD